MDTTKYVKCVFKSPYQVKPVKIELELVNGNAVNFSGDWYFIPIDLAEPYYFKMEPPTPVVGKLE